MKRSTAAAAALGVLVGLATAGAGLALTDDDPGWTMWPGGVSMSGMMSGRTSGGSMWESEASEGEAAWLREVVAHHQEAIDAARELARSDRREVRAFGERIVADQSTQVQQMQGWLDTWWAGTDDETSYEPVMRDLSALDGDALDRTFLEDMIGHHMAAVMMSQQLLVHGGATHDEVADLARTIRTDQSREIRWMRGRLVAWFGDDAAWHPGRMAACPTADGGVGAMPGR